MIQDALRYKAVLKVEDENYIFIRRAMNVKTKARMNRKANQRNKLGAEVANQAQFP